MVTNIPYKTSRDYKRLKELLDEGKEIVCFVDYHWSDGEVSRDICRARKTPSDFEPYQFSVRGYCYGGYDPKLDRFSFEKLMEAMNLEYIEPNL